MQHETGSLGPEKWLGIEIEDQVGKEPQDY